ncbi:putative xyloglucan galactosyltransferase GT17 [Prunus yedoensis var. nudiflora]|uniref:Putative xyloglucan galactosyltransferase GT17 n=1 Tax=Prunus yedoensis var. nudiflora TaxID=2094558 RepID=A0A314XW20_PRUYE|nr:putative xyloglucan galactosyltransferase GT17 [Prunus yedoensis var. nudiflora]
MFSEKQRPPSLTRRGGFLFLFVSAAWLVFWYPFTDINVIQQQHEHPLLNKTQHDNQVNKSPSAATTCDKNMSVYVYPLPAKFNLGLLHHCHNLNMHTDMCPHVANSGLGQPISSGGWFATNQFTAEMIFHARVENHPCRTRDPALASLFYVPYYGGFHVSNKFRERNLTARDELDVSLVDFIQAQPWWNKHNGKDHFVALGRVVRDFIRKPNDRDYGAGRLLNLPAVKNMSVLIIERHPWQGKNQYGIPYPSYFHPSTSQEMAWWQNKMRKVRRPYLFSFIGAPRRKAAIRNEFIRQCGESTLCKLLNCRTPDGRSKCGEPSEVLKVMTESRFCLQAPGDSFTRRSTFDSVLAGCIPVFFSPHSAYTQYGWYLPGERSSYSVFIDQKSKASERIEEELMKISSKKVKMMREKLLGLIPSLTYAHPNATNSGIGDAVDVALVSLAKQVNKIIN